MIPVVGLFLSSCNALSSISNLFGGKKEQDATGETQQSGNNSSYSQTPSDSSSSEGSSSSEEPKHVNENWPSDDLNEYLEYYNITDVFPGYTGASDEIELGQSEDGYPMIAIAVPQGTTEESVLATYVADILDAGYKEDEKVDGYMTYLSVNEQIYLLPYDGHSVGDDGYVLIMFAFPGAGEETGDDDDIIDDIGGDSADILNAINEAFKADGYKMELFEGEDSYYYRFKAYLGDESNTQAAEDVLKPAADQFAAKMPSELGESDGGKFYTTDEDYWQDKSYDTAYVYEYNDIPNDAGYARIIAYAYEGKLTVQVAYFGYIAE